MLSTIQDQTINFFEYALDIIEMYDKEYEKTREVLDTKEGKQGEQGSKSEFRTRLDFIKNDFQSILTRHSTNAYDYTKDMKVVKYGEKYSGYMNTQLVVPLKDNVFFVYSMTSNNISIVCKKLSDAKFLKHIASQYQRGKVTVHDSWMKLDLDNDGVVTLKDIKQNLKVAYEFVKNYEYIQKWQELKDNLYKTAIEYMKSDISEYKKSKDELKAE